MSTTAPGQSTPPTHSSIRPSNSIRPSKKVLFLSAGYGLFFVVMLVLAYYGRLPIGGLSRFHNFDKLGHLVLYFIPSYLGHQVCRCKHISRWHLPLFPGLFALFTVAEELTQGLSANRTLDALDMVCSLIGIGAGYWLAQRTVKQRRRKEHPIQK